MLSRPQRYCAPLYELTVHRSKRIEGSIKDIQEKSEGKKMEVSNKFAHRV